MAVSPPKYQIRFASLRTVVGNPELSPQAKAVLFDLLLFAGTNGKAYPSHQQLATRLGRSARSVQGYLNELRRVGLISWRREAFNGPSHYVFSGEIYFRTEDDDLQPTTEQSGSQLPAHTSGQLPPNGLSESNNECSQLQQRLEAFTGKNLETSETSAFSILYEDKGADIVSAAIDEVTSRGKRDINVGYLRRVAIDLKPPRPKFTPCGNCRNGYIPKVGEPNTMTECECRHKFGLRPSELEPPR